MNNIAEGAGKTSPADKRRYYTTARGSATESPCGDFPGSSAALLDVYLRLELASEDDHGSGKEMLFRIVSMLVKLTPSGVTKRVARSQENR